MKLRLTLVVFALASACSRDLALPDPPPVTGFLSGRVVIAVPGTSQSAPLPGATIALLSSNLHATSDDRGQFLLGPLPKGTYRVFFSSKGTNGTRQRLLTGVKLEPGATNSVGDVSIQENALLTGRALIQGRSQGNIGITIFSPGTDFVTTSADNGAWLLSNLPEGSMRASAWRPGFTPATTTDITLQGGIVTSAVDMILEPEAASAPPGAILGRVLVLGKEDNAGVTVKALSAQSQTVRATTTSDAAGAFTLTGLGPDLYTITLEFPGYPSARVPHLAVAGGVQLELTEPIVMAVTGEGNVVSNEPIGGPSGPLFGLDGGVTSPDGGVITTSDGGTIGAECTDDNQCASGRLCVDNRCVGCSVNVQCRPGYSCRGGDCSRDCTDNTQCNGGLVCISGSCTNCITSSDCRDAALVCNAQTLCAPCRDRTECPAGKACLPGGCGTCSADGDCGAGAICEQGVCTAGECHGNADCSSNEACVGRDCGVCTVDSQCRAGQLCVGSACVVGNCRSVLDCSAGQVCLGNLCGACAQDVNCGAGQLCLAGATGLRCTAGTCRVSGDCTGASAGHLCVNNQCTPCSSASPCTPGQLCNAQGRCVVGDCFSNLDCTGTKAGWACLAGNCTPCNTNSQCGASGYVCVSGTCRPGNCVQPADCPLPGQLCASNACIGCSGTSPCPANQVCDSDSLCYPGNCVTGSDCAPGTVCTNRICSPCTADGQCGLGKLCLGGACTAANCRVPADCAVAGQLCLANNCSSCTTTAQCGSGQVCDTGLCQTGNCVNASNCTAGRLCVSRTCTNCTADSQCGATRICVNGGCVTGVCRSDAECSGGLQLCDTNPASPTAYTCRGCTPVNTISGTTCGTGRACDAAGQCRVGNCLSNANCAVTQACINFSCTGCSQDSQCSGGRLCIGAQCLVGNCHGTDADCSATNGACINNVCTGNCRLTSDCNATNGVCVNNVCTGNCRTNPDCDTVNNGVCINNTCTGNCETNTDCATTGFCNTTTRFCAPCTGAGQCGVGKVCTPGGSGNTCVAAQCSSLEPNCLPSYSCVSGACMQLGPGTASADGGYVEPGVLGPNNFSPMALSGANTLYFSAYESSSPTGVGTYSVALEPNLALRWRVRDSTVVGGPGKNTFAGAGIVLPAPGFPGGELFLAGDGNGGAIAHRSDNGAQVWRIGTTQQAFATGVVNDIPFVAWVKDQSVSWMKTDGTGMRQLSTPTCTKSQALAFGTRAIYHVCGDALYVVDPITANFKTVPHGGNPANDISGSFPSAVTPIWRPPNNYTVRGVNSGTVTSDVLVYMGRMGADWMFAVNVPDDWLTTSSLTNTWTLWSNNSYGFNATPLAIDATGAIYVTGPLTFFKVSVFTGQQLSRAPMTGFTPWWNVAVNSQLIDISSGQMSGYLLADGVSVMPAPVWTLPALPGAYPNFFPTFQATTTNRGNLLAFQNNAQGQPTLQQLPPGPSAPAFLPSWPATSLAGDSANHATAPAYECTSDAQCAATQSCLLGRCAGTCRVASSCAAGLGCNLGNCGACSGPSSCRGGEVCWVGQCIPCVGALCCNTTSECASGSFCESGSCRVQPNSGVSGAYSLPNLVTRTTGGFTTVAPDGTLYVGDTNASNQPFWKVIPPVGSPPLPSTTPVAPFVLNTSGGPQPLVMVTKNGLGNTVWWGGGKVLYSAPASSSVGTWTTSTYDGFTGTFMRLSQGTSDLLGPARPTLFATANSAFTSNFIVAIDVANASVGGASLNLGLLWTGVINSSSCGLAGLSNPTDHLLIGSDGTIYVTCPDGSVMAWAADGDPSTGPPPSRLGLMKWRSAVPAGWAPSGLIGGRAAIGKTGSGDVLYYARGNNIAGLAILNLATAGNGTVPLEVQLDASGNILTDASGRAIVMAGTGAGPRELAIVSPGGVVLFSDKTTWHPSGNGAVLTAEGHLLMPELLPVGRLTAINVGNPPQVTALFSVTGPGNLPTDNTTMPVVLSPAQISGGQLFFDYPPLSGGTRSVSGYPFPGTNGPMPNAWSTRFGDQQRRNSLKTQ